MKKKSTYGLKPEQLGRLLSIGSEGEKSKDATSKDKAGQAHVPLSKHQNQPQIEGYEIVGEIGEAGQGQVWRALQLSTNRQVALKVPRAGLVSSEKTLARFEREVELAASLKHSNIAQIHDSGIHHGMYYYAMDLIEGMQLDEYVKQNKLTIRQVLELMRTICQAVQHAHQNGVIHRDLKPSNIIVTEDGQPYIVDFGLAKNLFEEDLSVTISIDGEAAGTPAYMSPEQAAGHIDKMDTRTDVYSLGVILFTLLTGESPHDLSGSRIEVMRRIAEEQVRRPRKISHQIDKDLEFLMLKALDNEPDRRYMTAGDMARDIDNYLQGAPLIAGPESGLYHIKKFVRRNRVLVAGIAAVLAVLAGGVVVSMLFAFGQARARAEAQAVSDFQRSVLDSFNLRGAMGKEITVRSILDATSQKLEGKFRDQPLFEASVRRDLTAAYGLLGLYEPAELHAKRALEIHRTQLGPKHIATVISLHYLGWVYLLQSRYYEAEPLFTRALAGFKLASGEGHRDRLFCMAYLGWVYNWQGRLQESEEFFTEALAAAHRVGGAEHPETPFLLFGLGYTHRTQGRYEEAERLYLSGLGISRRVLGEQFQDTLFLMHALGELRWAQGRYEEAEKLLSEVLAHRRKVWSEEHADTLHTMADLGLVYYSQGRYEEAESLFVNALGISREVLGEEHFATMVSMYRLGELYLSRGRYNEAEPLLNEALGIANHLMGEGSWYTLRVMNTLAKLYTKQKRYNEAESLFNETLKGKLSRLGADHPDTLESKSDLAVLYKEQGDYDRAEPLLIEAVEGRRLKLGDTHPHTLESWNNLIDLYEAWNKPEKADHWRAKLTAIDPMR